MNLFKQIFIGLVIATCPILSLYSIRHISVSFILMLFCYIFFIRKRLIALTSKYTKAIWAFALEIALISLNGLLLNYIGDSLILAIIMLLVGVVVYLPVMHESDKLITYYCFVAVAYICCIVAFYQFFATITGATYFSGRFEFLELDSSVVDWMPGSFGFRFNSLFSEPSYFAIYMLPIFAFSLKNNHYINSIFFGIGIILSSSSMGILCLPALVMYELVFKKGMLKRDYKSIIIIGVLVLIVVNIFQKNENIIGVLHRSTNKIERINSDGDSRLFGGIELYSELPSKESLFGVGLAQMANYFEMHGKSIPNYANTPVTILINCGAVGFLCLLIFYFRVFSISLKNNNLSFFFLLVAISCADPLIYNQRFYHLIYFIYFMIGNLPKIEKRKTSDILLQKTR